MRPRQLYQFLAICRHGSMSAAAHELGIAQPALSKQILQLEHELQVELFERHSRGVTLTKPGERLRSEATELIRRIEAIKTSILRQDDNITGTVNVAVIASLAPVLAVELYPRMEQHYPGITLHIADHSSEQAGQALLNQEAELAVTSNAATDLPQAQTHPLFEESFFFVSRTTPHGRTKPMSLAEAAAQPLVLPFHNHDLRRRLEDAARGIGVSLNVKYETSSINVLGAIVEQGLAASIVPVTYWLDRIAAGRIGAQLVVDPSVTRVHSLCWMPKRPMSAATKVVHDTLIMEIQSLISGGKLSGKLIQV
ncbi:LysR family transcriptional regulator [Pseudophaeobacter sp. EL27]|uniref:LysR family transcriptional regulator n=1 Tax=Pseudophaeobacter sp. EL27 TaxID=2107580 RepID=UPI0013C40DA0|nr:LysR family transcriptional regulator [Pseudophaeobacter sp. EL27]